MSAEISGNEEASVEMKMFSAKMSVLSAGMKKHSAKMKIFPAKMSVSQRKCRFFQRKCRCLLNKLHYESRVYFNYRPISCRIYDDTEFRLKKALDRDNEAYVICFDIDSKQSQCNYLMVNL